MAAVSWDALSWAYAFLGNSLMEPMTQGNHAGLDPSFWDTFPDFGSEELAEKLDECADCAQNLIVSYGDDAVNRTSVEYAHLFVGPPAPEAVPWEGHYTNGEGSMESTEPAADMAGLLNDVGIHLNEAEVPHLDHMGIELLYLSEICHRRQPESLGFIIAHPLSWIGAFAAKVEAAAGEGYYLALVRVAEALLEFQHKQMVAL